MTEETKYNLAEPELKDTDAQLRSYAILEAKVLILLHNQGDQDPDVLATKLCIEDEPEAKRPLRLALGNLVKRGLIRPSTCIIPGITIVDELRPIVGGFDHDAAIRKLELP